MGYDGHGRVVRQDGVVKIMSVPLFRDPPPSNKTFPYKGRAVCARSESPVRSRIKLKTSLPRTPPI